MPHLLAADSAAATSPGLREQADDAAWYLLMRGDTRLGYDLATRLYQRGHSQLGDDDPATLRAATSIATALTQMGRHADACKLDKDILDRRRRVLGADHPETLQSASNLAVDLPIRPRPHLPTCSRSSTPRPRTSPTRSR